MAKKKNEDRFILIDTDFAYYVECLLGHFSIQLSDGYWENSGGEWSTDINNNYCAPYWNYLQFTTKYPTYERPYIAITIKAKPTYEECEDIFSSMTDEEVMNYIIANLEEAYDEAPCAFYNEFSDKEMEILIDCLKCYTMHLKPLPKLTHEELVKKLGYEFEYSG